MQHEDGFYFHALPSPSGSARALIIILHGHGSHPDQYLKWAKKTQAENPAADVLVVRAPVALQASEEQKRAQRLPAVDDLYTWYNLDEKPVAPDLKQPFNRAAIVSQLNRFIDAQMKKRNLQDENLAIIGFSQGALMAVDAALHSNRSCAAVVSHSGAVMPFAQAARKPDVLMIMGDKDDLFSLPEDGSKPSASRTVEAFRKAGIKANMDHPSSVERLKKAGIAVTEKVVKNQGHRITEESWHEASAFVAKKLKLKK